MEDEHLSLTWNNHGATYQQMLNLLRIENILTDCTLACDGQKFSVHRLVLVTCSDFFKSLLGDVPCQYPIVYLKGISGKEMQALIDFMYIGKIDVPQKEVPNLLSTAETLQIKGLGVLNAERKEENHISCKRKRPSNLNAESSDTSLQNENVSSPLPKFGACENICSERDHASFKISRKDWTTSPGCDQPFSKVSHLRSETYYAQTRDKIGSGNKGTGNESILSSIFKSSPVSTVSTTTSIPSSGSEMSVNTALNPSNYTTSKAIRTAKESPPVAPLSSLQSYSNDRSNSSANFCGRTLEARVNGASCSEENPLNSHPLPELETLADVKEEAIDYTRGSALEVPENAHLVSRCSDGGPTGAESGRGFPVDDASPFLEGLRGKGVSLPLPFTQDENAENGSEFGRPYLCPICRKSFAKVAILKRHHLAHFRPYNCHLCSRSFTRREVLAEHVLEHNGADLRLPCPVCKMTIKRKRNLQAHIKVKHPEYQKQKSANNEALC